MKLDIVLITYNQAQYIAQALDGLIMQRVNSDVEMRVIIADDASTDDTLTTIRSYEEHSPFPFIYLPQEANMGHVLNYKRAFAACTGDYVAILEGDDWWCNPYHLQKHLDFLDEHRECVLSSACSWRSSHWYKRQSGASSFRRYRLTRCRLYDCKTRCAT